MGEYKIYVISSAPTEYIVAHSSIKPNAASNNFFIGILVILGKGNVPVVGDFVFQIKNRKILKRSLLSL